MRSEANSKKIADNLISWIRQYASSNIDSHLTDKQHGFQPHVFLDLGNQGFFGMHVSRKYGGLELKTYDLLRVIEQVAAIDLTLTVLLIESIQGAHTLENYATESMKNQYLNLLAKGRIFTAGAMTESAAGSSPRAMKSVATPDGDGGWLLNGSKRWVGMAASASITALYVQQVDENNNWQGMSGFLVPQGVKGLHIGPETPTMGLRGFAKNTIHMDNIKVSAEHLLGKSGQGMEIAQDNMMYIRLCLASAAIGAMKRSVQLIFRYATRRTIATGQLIENPVTLARLSEMTAIIDAIENFVYLVAEFYDKNPSSAPEEAFVVSKLLGSEYLGWMVDLLLQTLGARGYDEGSGVAKLFRDARVFRIFEGPTEALNMYIGSRILAKNSSLERFISNSLNQKQLFNEIKFAVNNVNEHCLVNKRQLFAKPFSINYWSQALVGEIISYGLLLAGIEYTIKNKPSENLQRASVWLRNKYNEVVQKALSFSLAEKVLIQPNQLQEYVSNYTDKIGNVEQIRISQDIALDNLLKCNYEPDIHENTTNIEQELFSKELWRAEIHDDHPLVVNETERQRLLHEWNNLEKENEFSDSCVTELFEKQVNLSPEAIAIVFQDKKITYEELNTQVNKVAFCLKNEGIKEDKLVGIYVERSIEMIIGLLGILKAGGAYLPLDYKYPKQNLNFMAQDSAVSIILSHKKLSNNIPFEDKKILFIDDILNDASLNLTQDYKSTVTGDNLGYVIYTSGSTGKPKGVMLPHKALANLINWHKNKIQDKRNVLQFTTLNFDMSFLEIFSALTSGGTLMLISEQDRMDLLSYSKIVKKYHVEQVVMSVPFLKRLVEAKVDKKYFATLKEIIIAGEQLLITPAIRSFFNQLNYCKLLNYYGPSETHVVTAYEFPEKPADWPEYPPIGRVISNTKILILDDNKQIVPIGATGEIHIGGICLAKGYINSKELTQLKFIPDPWGEKQGDLLYKTGDFGKYLPDGNLIYLGRKDEQVKIRGFRIEPQEIEWNLLKYPGIKEAIVIAKKDRSMENRLEAFIVIDDNGNENLINSIYSFLQNRLPPHMLPSIFHIIDKIPLTDSGKINRNALENHEKSSSNSFNKIIEPITKTEKAIIAVMGEVFNLHIGINNSFTSIGGNSLLAMHIVSKLQDIFSVEIPAYTLLSDPTIADTAKRIDALKEQSSLTPPYRGGFEANSCNDAVE